MKYLVFLFLEIFSFLSVYCTNRSDSEDYPINIYSDRYDILQRGIYRIKSIDSTLIASAKVQLVANIFNDTTFLEKQNVMYLANEKPIALFSKMNNVATNDVAGVLNQSTLVTVDSIYYNNRYIDSEDAPMTLQQWYDLTENDNNYFLTHPISYVVWYVLNINGKKYYTDYKLHDMIEYKLYMPTKRQLLLLCSQSTGYDGGYDLGYPDYYVIVVLEEGKDGWKEVYRSHQLDLNNGGEDEYGLSQIYPVEVSNKDNDVVIYFSDYFRITWNGKSAIVDILKEYE